MALRTKLQATATRLITKFGDTLQSVTYITTAGATEFDLPTITPVSVNVEAVVTGVSKWDVSDTIFATDLVVLVSGVYGVADVGGSMTIDGKAHTIVAIKPILAAGVKTAVKYYVRRG